MEAADAAIKTGTGLAEQYTMLAAILLAIGVGLWFLPTFLKRLREANGGPAHAAPTGGSDAILHAITGVTKEIADQGHSIAEHIDKVEAKIEKRLADHEERDNQRFDTAFGLINGRQPSPQPRPRVAAVARDHDGDRQWKAEGEG